MPEISVIMGVYNGAKKLKYAIQSIQDQTFKDFEFIICDDGSSDESIEIVKEFASKDNRIILIENSRNMGLAMTLNNCLKVAQGKYIARMDDDDKAHPTRFEKQFNFLESREEYAIVGTGRNMYDDKGIWGQSIREGERSKLDIYLGRTFAHPSVMIRKEAIQQVNGYSTSADIGRTEDFDLWCKLYFKGYKGYNLGEALIDYYEARDSYSKRKYKYRICEYKLKKRWRKRLGVSWKYNLYAYRPLLVGMLPSSILMSHHEKRFAKRHS
ncbi:glycosyltransferase family 2 protein [Priestia megaterium]|uniref:glycosyltransferase family 2 protein n=1 Tax=Priestia megaterium TaxID=1404 RepID=UPI001785796A|nr:glycosyltransferase [Priestia megaterium]MBD8110042.1 glycosyltransferase [Priestia megaterium]